MQEMTEIFIPFSHGSACGILDNLRTRLNPSSEKHQQSDWLLRFVMIIHYSCLHYSFVRIIRLDG
jgi:hypothetical protein